MPASSTSAGESSSQGSSFSRRRFRRAGTVSDAILMREGSNSLLDAGFLQGLIDLAIRPLERVGGGQALEVDLVQGTRPGIAHTRALGLRHPGDLRRLQVLGDRLEIAAA